MLTYLAHEVVQYSRCWADQGPGIWRKFGISIITRYNVTSKCTAASIGASNPGKQFDQFVNYGARGRAPSRPSQQRDMRRRAVAPATC